MIEFLMICRNNEHYFKYIFPVLLEKIKIYEPKFYIYENNSTDNTKNELKKLIQKYNILLKSENIKLGTNKYKNICVARNNLLKYYRDNSDSGNNQVILLDTNIIFNRSTINELINNSYKGLMILSNTKFYSNKKKLNNKYYYDLLALNYGVYFNENKLITFDNYKENKIKLDSGFGGIVLINKNFILNNNWTLNNNLWNKKNLYKNIVCEHWSFCNKINNINGGDNIYLIKSAKSLWFLDKYIENSNERTNFYEYINKFF